MTNTSATIMTLAEFERLLDVYGGDRTRWPVDARAAAAQLVARDKAAQHLLSESVALDRVLERAPLPSLAVEAALADRIVTAAQRSPRIISIGDPVAGSERDPASVGSSMAHRRGVLPADLRKAVVLAASLMVGVYIGLSNIPQQIVPTLTGASDTSGVTYNMAVADPLDEDVL
jgi:hypothetical protein